MKKRIKFMVTAFRDGFQSVYGARVFTKDFLPALEASVEAGIDHFEAGGGARFQSLYFYCNEDAFDMMDAFRKTVGPDVNLQTLARGVNVVGLDSQPRDVIKLHAQLFKKHGITSIRNFDALNDVNNLIYSGQCIVDSGLKHEISVTMMELPPGSTGAHTPEFYVGVLKQILDSGIHFDSICFKDASGTSVPSKVYETIKQARNMLGKDRHIVFHTHETAGASILCYKAAIEAGADQVDLSMMPASGGTCQPDIVTMWHALRGTDYDLGIDINKIIKAEEVFQDCMKEYFMPPEAKKVEPLIPFSPMPGGALTANTQMMRDNGILDKYNEVAAAMGEVVVRGGFGTSVTPVSQFYFQQAFNNVMMGPWKKIAEGYGKMVLGYFGKTPVEPDPEIIALAKEQLGLEPTTDLVIDINDKDPNKGLKKAEEVLKAADLPTTEENLFIAATCKEKGIAFLKGEAKANVRKIVTETEGSKLKEGDKNFIVNVNSKRYSITLEGSQAIVDGKSYDFDISEGSDVESVKVSPTEKTNYYIEAPMPGLILRIVAKPGDRIKEGDLVLVMEAMKMETEIHAPVSGTITSIPVSLGDQKKAGEVLVVVEQ